MFKKKLTLFIFLSLVGGVLAGWLFPEQAVLLKPLADIFIRMIKMIIAPLVFSTLVVGIAGHGGVKNLGKMAFKTIVYFEIATIIALVVGLSVANHFQPGAGVNLTPSASNMQELEKLKANHTDHASPVESLVHMVPTSVVDSMAKGDILGVVVFAVFFAIALAAIGDKGKPILDGLSSLAEVMFKFTEYVMLFAPMGIFAAISHTVAENGIGILSVYGNLIMSLYFALFLFLALLASATMILCKVSFFQLLKSIRDPLILAFSTASSEAALPKAMEIMEKFGVPKNVVGFVMPTGYTFNLDGSTLYLSLATLFIAQIYNIHLPIEQQLLIMFTLMFTSKGIAGVPRVSLVILTGTLLAFNMPVAGVAVLLGIDHVLDMGRTTVNLIGNCVATVMVSTWEKNFNQQKMKSFLEETNNKPFFVLLKAKCSGALLKNGTNIANTFFRLNKGNLNNEKENVSLVRDIKLSKTNKL